MLSEGDHVGVAVRRLIAGENIESPLASGSDPIVPGQAIPAGHKIALRSVAIGDPVLKYGSPIGVATEAISVGDHVHSHNLADAHESNMGNAVTGRRSTVRSLDPENTHRPQRREFLGYDRGDGRVGTRNYVLIASRVNCSATVCHQIAKRFPVERLAEFPNVDGIALATHTTGCALQYASPKQQALGRVLRGYAAHANVGATLMIGLGCEQTTPEYLKDHHRLVSIGVNGSSKNNAIAEPSCQNDEVGVAMLTMQAEGGTRATIDRGERMIETLLDQANQFRRTPVDASHLRLALECGGSDGYSGVTANPVVGRVADLVVAHGGAAVLSETTEIYGAEHLLTSRAVSDEVAAKLIAKIQWWKEHVAVYGGVLDNNPSIGNKAGGLTTITEKSLGAVAKSGTSPLVDVVDYAAPIPTQGLSVMDTPGFDPASVTGKVAGGCNLVLFTTGRGSCFGGKPVPVIKIASNSLLFESMSEDMDFDAGVVLTGQTIESVGDRLWEQVLLHASGTATCSEQLGLGDHEFVPWTVGPTL
ncbi:Altronate dehydratase [Neorhodopirellula pilleata]|uniref:Altronate dehydratase n=1 Tax=Neorhodopirellula pilleata TaxID=2714738 RepID=A0A5C6ANR7_9BACT|nr:Altronate dehydratase [Neorhodopirellula pilleata]